MKQISYDLINTDTVPSPIKAFGTRKDSPFDPLIAAAMADFDKSLKIPITGTKEYMRFRSGLQRAAKRAKVQITFSKDSTHLYLTAIPPKVTPQPVKVQPAMKKTSSIAA